MKTTGLFILALTASLTAYADFSYTTTRKTTGGSMAAMAGSAGNQSGKAYLKGQKLMTTTGETATIIDFGAQTIITINNAQKTYTVKKFSDVGAGANGMDVSIDVKDTGQEKNVNGYNAKEMLVNMTMDMDTGRGAPMKMQMEIDMWLSSDVPGAGEMRAFYQKNMSNFPWAAMMGSGNQSMQKAMAQMQRKMAELNGMPVEQIIRIKPASGPGAPQMAQMPQMTTAQAAQMQAAMAKMQEMAKQGGPGAAAAQQMMANMGAMNGASSGGSGALIEITADESDFSTASIPDSMFAIPAGYKQSQ